MDIPYLTSGESKVYSTLVALGESSVGSVIKKSGVSHSKIYEILERLGKKGLVSSIVRSGRQYFSAADPVQLRAMMNEKRKELSENEEVLQEVIEKLKVQKSSGSAVSPLRAYEGIAGIKSLLEGVLLENPTVVFIWGTPSTVNRAVGGYLKDWQQRRIEKGIVCRILADKDAKSWSEQWWKDSKKKKLTYTKRIDSVSPSFLVITEKSVVTIHFEESILGFSVVKEGIAKRYIDFFMSYWR